MRESPFLWACVAAACYGLAFALGLGIASGASFGGGAAHDWIDAVGSAGAAVVAVGLGYLALARTKRDEAAKARITAYVLVDEFAALLATLRLLAMDDADEDSEMIRGITLADDGIYRAFAKSFKQRGLPRTKAEFSQLPSLPGELGFHVASYVSFYERLCRRLEHEAEIEIDERITSHKETRSIVRAVLPNCSAVFESLRAIAEGRSPPYDLGSRAKTDF